MTVSRVNDRSCLFNYILPSAFTPHKQPNVGTSTCNVTIRKLLGQRLSDADNCIPPYLLVQLTMSNYVPTACNRSGEHGVRCLHSWGLSVSVDHSEIFRSQRFTVFFRSNLIYQRAVFDTRCSEFTPISTARNWTPAADAWGHSVLTPLRNKRNCPLVSYTQPNNSHPYFIGADEVSASRRLHRSAMQRTQRIFIILMV